MLLLWILVSEYPVGVDVGEILSFLAMVENIGQAFLVSPTILRSYSDSNGNGSYGRCELATRCCRYGNTSTTWLSSLFFSGKTWLSLSRLWDDNFVVVFNERRSW